MRLGTIVRFFRIWYVWYFWITHAYDTRIWYLSYVGYKTWNNIIRCHILNSIEYWKAISNSERYRHLSHRITQWHSVTCYPTVVVVVVTRSDQPKPPAVAIVRQNGLSSASCRASVAVTPVSRQIWWIQVVGGRPLARLLSCEGRSPSLVLVQIRSIWFAGTSLRSLPNTSIGLKA